MTPAPPPKPQAVGPIGLAFSVSFGLVSVAVGAWVVGMLIEIGGGYFLWKSQGIRHAQSLVQQDLEYIAAAPRSLLVRDTVAFSLQLAGWVRMPYEKLGVLRWYQRMHAPTTAAPTAMPLTGQTVAPQLRGIGVATADAARVLSEWLVISMFVAQDVLLRMAIGAFAMPAFVLACLIGVVDGLVRRDRRRWTGGRESSFVYHHAKRYTGWALTGGFGLYLSWPFGGFNPAHMVLVFTVLVAVTLSTTVGAFKKYA